MTSKCPFQSKAFYDSMILRENQHTEGPGWAGRLGQQGQHEEADSPLLEIFTTGFDGTLYSPI